MVITRIPPNVYSWSLVSHYDSRRKPNQTNGFRPLPVRVGLRDSFDSPNSAVQKSLKSLNDVVGYDITLEIAWVDIWNDLQSQFSADKTTFVPTITDAIATWLKRTEDLLESSEEFQEAFMDKMDRLRKALFIQV